MRTVKAYEPPDFNLETGNGHRNRCSGEPERRGCVVLSISILVFCSVWLCWASYLSNSQVPIVSIEGVSSLHKVLDLCT